MKNKKKLLIVLIIGFLIAGQIFFISYRQISSEVITYNFSSENMIKKLDIDSPYQIVFYGLDDYIQPIADSSAYIIKVYVDRNTSMGILRYLPLFKPVSFKSEVSYKWDNPNIMGSVLSGSPESGKFDIEGKCNLLGYFTSTRAEQIINELINKSITVHVQNDLNHKLNF